MQCVAITLEDYVCKLSIRKQFGPKVVFQSTSNLKARKKF